MGKVHGAIDERIAKFINRQVVFFVATAPLSADAHVNVSPRGLPGTFAVLDEKTFAWLDVTGSGSETIAHLRENGRITVMFCAFDGPPNIVRLHGKGRVVSRYDPDFDSFAAHFEDKPGTRAVIVVDVTRVSDSCGWGVPLMTFEGHRELLGPYFSRKGAQGSAEYRVAKNRVSIDGLAAYDFDPMETGKA
ncbi:pyridoxamine 5'-phosphate oxidase family protein [Arthrobacter sp. SIMBA_036]|uniref:pyridoxamine 5'-phosphate oxidase family protein n=1 Tax=Arthrobacter sp. SIMBA_036 TaxID=3085778 RepID=UPI0039788BC2